MNSRDKGKRGELEAARWLRDRGYESRRGQQFKGTEDSPDVTINVPVHIEVKRRERLNIYEALQQAIDEAPEGRIPVVLHRRNRKDWVVILRADDYFKGGNDD